MCPRPPVAQAADGARRWLCSGLTWAVSAPALSHVLNSTHCGFLSHSRAVLAPEHTGFLAENKDTFPHNHKDVITPRKHNVDPSHLIQPQLLMKVSKTQLSERDPLFKPTF